ncbi:MAG: hypothetical protein HRF45_11670, partial [Fimbriimonadia bacterium]
MVGRIAKLRPVSPLFWAILTLPCLAQPRVVNIIGDKQVGGLSCDSAGLPEYCQYRFVAQLDPVPPGCTVEYDWTFEGCGAQVREGGDTASPLVRFNQTGVCNISLEAHVVEAPGCSPQQWVGTAIYFVVGGPFDIVPANGITGYAHDYHQEYLPWYITFHGFDPPPGPGPPAWPRHLQPPAGIKATARYAQPQGDRYHTVYPTGSLCMKGVAPNGSSQAREAEFYARSGSQMGGLEIWLVYAVIYDDVRLGEAWDDSHLVHTTAYENYRRLTAHKPKGTDLVSADPELDHTTLLSRPPPDPPPYYNSRYYMYRLRDHLGFWMPGTSVNERFPNGVPQGLKVNNELNPWVTRWTKPWDGPEVGRFGDLRNRDKADWIRAGVPAWWPIEEHQGSPYQFPNYAHDRILQRYVAGSSDTAVAAPGCLVGEREVMFWSDQIQHLPSRWPAWDWPPDPLPPPP